MAVLPILYNEKEILYHRKQFQETLKVHGIGVEYLPVVRKNMEDALDFYNDIKDSLNSYLNPIEIRILFDEAPTTRTLKSLGWYIEDQSYPILAYIPTEYIDKILEVKLINPNVDDKIILIDNTIGFEGERSKRTFIIKDIKSQGYPNTIYNIAKLVPFYESKDGTDLLDSE